MFHGLFEFLGLTDLGSQSSHHEISDCSWDPLIQVAKNPESRDSVRESLNAFLVAGLVLKQTLPECFN